MDKLAPAIDWLKEYGFWLANGLLLLLMIGIWYLQIGRLTEEKDKSTKKIDSQFRTVQAVMQKTPEDAPDDVRLHPNQATQEGMQAELEETVKSIVAAWHLQVKRQKQLLVFPAVIENEKFDEVFAQYNPPETFPVKYADIKTIDALLSLYRVKIQDHMINICGKNGVRTNWCWDEENYDQDTGVGASDVSQSSPVTEADAARFAVLWSVINQKLWNDKLTKFRDRDDHNKESNDPTPLQCYMLQQDLWVLEAMFNVIAELNGDSTATDTSAIKQIDHIGIGREGYQQSIELQHVDARFGPQADGGGDQNGGENSFDGGTGSAANYGLPFSEEELEETVTDDATETETNQPPFHNMYVDTKFEPISAEQVLAVVKGEGLSETNLELLIAKRLPVRIGLKMDERKIPDFMAACINSPFSFEIQQVRINRHTPGGESIGLGGGGSTRRSRVSRTDNRGKDFDDVERIETRVNYDVNVEFSGIIKIYNPVRADLIRKAVGIETEDAADSDGNSLDAASKRSGSTGVRTAS